jgi:hypothetical protein
MERKRIYLLSGIGIATIFSFGLYYFIWRKRKTYTLTSWLEEYIQEVEAKMKKDGDKLSNDTILSIFNVLTEIDDEIFTTNNSDLIRRRRASLGNPAEYEKLAFESYERDEFSKQEARNYLEKRLGLTFDILTRKLREKKLAEVVEHKKAYPRLPAITVEKLKGLYRFYVKLVSSYVKLVQQQMKIVESNPEYEGQAMRLIHLYKCTIEDKIMMGYGIRKKYVPQLVREYELSKDTEMKCLMIGLGALSV